jgi:hypothetical protein
MLRERSRTPRNGCHIRCVAAQRCSVLTCLSRGAGVRAEAIFDVRALLTPPLAAERMIRLFSNGVFVQKCVLDRKRSYLTEKGLFSRKAPSCGESTNFRFLLMRACSNRPICRSIDSRTRGIRLGQNANNRARHKRSENQVDRTRVREVRIQFLPAESQQTFGSSKDGARCSIA